MVISLELQEGSAKITASGRVTEQDLTGILTAVDQILTTGSGVSLVVDARYVEWVSAGLVSRLGRCLRRRDFTDLGPVVVISEYFLVQIIKTLIVLLPSKDVHFCKSLGEALEVFRGLCLMYRVGDHDLDA